MVIIGFSTKTSKKFVRVCCRHFKHCVIITGSQNRFVLHQFVRRNYVKKIPLDAHAITQLKHNGWVFILSNCKRAKVINPHAMTCVNYAKAALNIKNFWIQTPDDLYKYLTKKLT